MSAFVPSLVDSTSVTISFRSWPDPVIDEVGFDPRDAYFEMFWVGVVGPSPAWLLRRLCTLLDAGLDSIDGLDLARQIGWPSLGSGKNAPLRRAVERLCHFKLVARDADGTIAVRRRVPPLALHQIRRLPPSLRGAHDAWQARQLREHANGSGEA